jgi:hypothetical protein
MAGLTPLRKFSNWVTQMVLLRAWLGVAPTHLSIKPPKASASYSIGLRVTMFNVMLSLHWHTKRFGYNGSLDGIIVQDPSRGRRGPPKFLVWTKNYSCNSSQGLSLTLWTVGAKRLQAGARTTRRERAWRAGAAPARRELSWRAGAVPTRRELSWRASAVPALRELS